MAPETIPQPQGAGWRIDQQRYSFKSVQVRSQINNNMDGSIRDTSSTQTDISLLELDKGAPLESAGLPSGGKALSAKDVDWSRPLRYRYPVAW